MARRTRIITMATLGVVTGMCAAIAPGYLSYASPVAQPGAGLTWPGHSVAPAAPAGPASPQSNLANGATPSGSAHPGPPATHSTAPAAPAAHGDGTPPAAPDGTPVGPTKSGPSGSPTTGTPTTGNPTSPVTPPPGASSCPRSTGRASSTAPGTGRTVALTFDDGPGPDTGQILDILAAQHVHATFFTIGSQVAADPGIVRRAQGEGNLIGNHTWDHLYPRDVAGGWTPAYLSGQITRTDAAVMSATGSPTCYFRPPGGFMPSSVATDARALRQQVVLWSVDPEDWKVESTTPTSAAQAATMRQKIYTAAIAGTQQAHPVLLLHDGGGYRGATVAALPSIISYYQAHGYQFVLLDGRS